MSQINQCFTFPHNISQSFSSVPKINRRGWTSVQTLPNHLLPHTFLSLMNVQLFLSICAGATSVLILEGIMGMYFTKNHSSQNPPNLWGGISPCPLWQPMWCSTLRVTYSVWQSPFKLVWVSSEAFKIFSDCLGPNRDDRLLNNWTLDELYAAVKLHPKMISQIIQAQRNIFQALVISLMYLDLDRLEY